MPPPTYLPRVVRSGQDAVHLLQPARREARGHHLVEDQQRAGLARQRAQARRGIRGSAGMQPLVPCIGSIRIAASSARCGPTSARLPSRSLYSPEQKLERRVERAALAAEIKHAAVIAAVEHQDLLAGR